MTKKFWNDWQKRFGETLEIYMKYSDDRNGFGYHLFYPHCSRIIKGTFDNDTLTLVLETRTPVFDSSGLHYHNEKSTMVVQRKNIKSVLFRKY